MVSAGLVRAAAILGLNVQHAVHVNQVFDGVGAIRGFMLPP